MPFTGPGSKPAYTVRGGGVRKDGAAVEEDGSVSARMHANRTRTIWRRKAYCPEGQERAGHWWWYWKRQGAEDGLRFAWRASFYGTQWQQHPVPCHLQLAGH